MFKLTTTVIAAGMTLLTNAPSSAADLPGLREIEISAPERAQPVGVMIWYPAQDGGTPAVIGDNPVFFGTKVMRNADLKSGTFPLVVLSHGSGGNPANLGWLAGRLAGQGMIVAAPKHPGTSSGDSRQDETMKMWQRPADMSAVIDALTADPLFAARIDVSKIVAMGFSLGGYAAMAAAGVEFDMKRYARFCDEVKVSPECIWLAKGGVNLHGLNDPRLGQSHRDPRFSAAIAIDPGFVPAYTAASLRALAVPMAIVNLGAPGTLLQTVDAGDAVKLIAGATYETVEGAGHFSFLGLCKPEGPQVLLADKDDPVCDETGGRDRAALHDEIAAKIERFLRAIGYLPQL